MFLVCCLFLGVCVRFIAMGLHAKMAAKNFKVLKLPERV